MKQIFIFLLAIIGVAQAQFAPTSAKTRFANGIAFNTRDTSAYNSADSLVVVINRQGRMMYRSTDGLWKYVAINNDTAQMLIAYLRKSDTANMLSPYLRKSDTSAMLSPYARTSSLGIFVPYTGAAANLDMGTFRVTSRSAANDSILARSSAGAVIATNTGTTVASYGAGGSAEMTFNGFAGYNTNRASSYTARSFTDKNYVDSGANLRKLVADTFFTTGYTTRARTKQLSDSLAATKLNLTGGVLSGTLIGTNFSATNLFVSTSSNEFLRSIPATAAVAQFQTWFNSAGTRRGYFGFASGGSNITLENETASGDLVFRMNGGVLINTATTDGISKLIVNGQAKTSNLLVDNGITGQRGRVTSLVVNKDSIPITASNAWVLTVDTTGTPYTNRVNRRNINDFYVGNASFDTTARTLTLPKAGGGSTVVTIPRGTASGTSGITALSSSRTGNLVTVSGDNGSSTIFSVRDADSSAPLESLTASFGISGSPYNGTAARTWLVDTSSISTKANVTGSLVAKLNISDTLGMLSNRLRVSDTLAMLSNYNRKSDTATMLFPYLRKSDTATMLLPFMQYSDTANQMSGYLRKNFALLLQDTTSAFSNYLRKSDTLTMLSNRLKVSDTSAMLSPYARTSNLPSLAPYVKYTDTASLVAPYLRKSDTSAMLSSRVKYSDTANIVAGYLRKGDTASMLNPYTRLQRFTDSLTAVQSRIQTKLAIADTASMLSAYTRLQRFNDSLTAVQARIQTKQPLGAYITLADSSTILAGRWLPNRSGDSIAVIRALANSRGTVFSVATNNATGINGGTITSTGTLAIDTVLISTRAWRQKAVDSLNGLISARVRIADTSTMLLPYLRKTDTTSMLSNYRRSSTLILNSNLANSTISGVALGGNLNNHLNGYGISGTAYNGALNQTWQVDTVAISTKANVTGALVAKLNISDTLTMLSRYLRKSDTATMLAPFVQYSDTANQMNGYLRKNFALLLQDTATAFGNYLRKSDTATMLTRYLRKTDTTAMLLPYLRKTDTASMLSPYYRTATATAALGLKLNISDTSTMLLPYLRKTDTTNMLSNYRRTSTLIQQSEVNGLATSLAAKLNISDTLTMLSPYRRTSTKITNSDLANSTISGIALGSNLNNLSAGNGLVGTAYNGGAAQSWRVDTTTISTKANVTGSLVAKLNISDTSTMLSPYARTSNLPSLTPYLLKADSLSGGYTTWLLTKKKIDSLGILKVNYTDTASMLSNYRRSSTQIRNADLQFFQISGISLGNNLFNLNTPYGLTGTNYNGSAPVTDWKVDTSTISTKANVTGSLVAKLNISDTSTMLSNYRRKTTLIENTDLRNFRISGISLGSNLPNLNTPYGLTGTNYNGSALVDDWKVDTGRASIKIITGGALNKVRDSITSSTVNLTGNQTIGGNKTFTSTINGTTASFNGLGLNSSPVSAGTNQTYQQLSNTNGSFYLGKESSTAGGFFTGSSAYANVIYSVGTSNQIEFIQGGVKNLSLASNGDAEFTKSVKSAGLIQPISLKTTNYTLTTNDHTVIFDVTAASRTATLPAGVEGQIFVIKLKGSSSNTVTVMPNGSNTVEGLSSYVVSGCNGTAITIQFLSGNWEIISNNYVTSCF